jgi:hypothetical protein
MSVRIILGLRHLHICSQGSFHIPDLLSLAVNVFASDNKEDEMEDSADQEVSTPEKFAAYTAP